MFGNRVLREYLNLWRRRNTKLEKIEKWALKLVPFAKYY
jgi:hypothetical protein